MNEFKNLPVSALTVVLSSAVPGSPSRFCANSPTDWRRIMTKFIEGLAKGNHKDIKLFHLEGDYMFAILSDPEHGCYLGGYGGVTVHSKDETGDFTNAIEVEWTEGDTSLDTGRLEGAFLRFMRRDSIQDLVLTCHHTRDCHNGWLMVRFTKGPDNTLLASYYRHTGPLVPELLQRYIEPK